ncbi:hypothetical protein RHGRI_010394 [Rhododendron griersonianum]|uniref:Uncharacterized protein n=1 Tax=Rhododendron griersonianum TaxID=479676 RepID=A0AAV6KJF7_9ERIC|nr:hypothetical protein RHGRI_010394 [Rhododendron griersonianum]
MLLACWLSRREVLGGYRALLDVELPEVGLVRGWNPLVVAVLKNRVNIGCGTPSRIQKLIDVEALGLSRLAVIVLDRHTDVKGYSLFTLPQVRDEFWDLYKCYFHPRLLQVDLRICLYGPVPISS